MRTSINMAGAEIAINEVEMTLMKRMISKYSKHIDEHVVEVDLLALHAHEPEPDLDVLSRIFQKLLSTNAMYKE